jgi:hypothetical protein
LQEQLEEAQRAFKTLDGQLATVVSIRTSQKALRRQIRTEAAIDGSNYRPDPANDPNDAYAVINTPAELREPLTTGSTQQGLSDDWLVLKPDEHRRFLVSFELGEPDWALLDVPGASELPAVKWRQQDLDKQSKQRRDELVEGLERVRLIARGRLCHYEHGVPNPSVEVRQPG